MKAFSQKVPPEILTEIFEWVYLIAVDIPQPCLADGKHVRRSCWPVSQVCRCWREVALAAPFLWTYLPTINLDDDESPSPSQQLERLKELIPRTRNHTLHISAVGSIDMNFDQCLEVVDYITEYCERWETLSMKASADYLDEFFADIRGCLPRLEMLKLDLLDGDGAALTLFVEARNLKFVHITGIPSGLLELDTRALLHLYDDTAMIMHNLQPTHEFPQLTSVEVRDTDELFDYSKLSIDDDVVFFPVLKILDYSCDDGIPADLRFLKFVDAPRLEELSVTANAGNVIGCLMDLYNRCGSLPLKRLRLRIKMDKFHEQAFSDLLNLSLDLESLEVNIPRVRDILRLATSQDQDVLVPRLRECTFVSNGNVIDDGVHHAITELAEARCRRHEPSGSNANASTCPTIDKNDMVTYTQLCLRQNLSSRYINPPRATEGFGYQPYAYPKIYPMKLEPWHQRDNRDCEAWDTDSDDKEDFSHRHRSLRIRRRQRDAGESIYAKVVSEIPSLMSPAEEEIDLTSPRYKRILKLIAKLEEKYKSENLVDFLAENTSPCLIYLAYALKNHLPHHGHNDDKNLPYGRVVCILKKVKVDLLQRLDKFHWIWEIYPDAYVLRYIHDDHEIRADGDTFANAILGLSNDLWILQDF